MTSVSEPTSFEEWLTTVGPTPEDLEPEDLDWARETYALRGPISRDELEYLAFGKLIRRAEEAFPAVTADIERTTGLVAHLQIWWPDMYPGDLSWCDVGLSVGFGPTAGPTTTAGSVNDWGSDLPSALVAVADFVMEPVMEEQWSGWPVCPRDGYGLDPELADGRAIWRCRSPRNEVVAPIGELGPTPS